MDRPRTAKDSARQARDERLAAALRANVRRRKAQARARAQTETVLTGAAHESAGIVQEISTGPKV
jgi:hypothetical protein